MICQWDHRWLGASSTGRTNFQRGMESPSLRSKPTQPPPSPSTKPPSIASPVQPLTCEQPPFCHTTKQDISGNDSDARKLSYWEVFLSPPTFLHRTQSPQVAANDVTSSTMEPAPPHRPKVNSILVRLEESCIIKRNTSKKFGERRVLKSTKTKSPGFTGLVRFRWIHRIPETFHRPLEVCHQTRLIPPPDLFGRPDLSSS
jgi:hypothetical protein